jgi:aldose 1-epimerase
MTSTWLEADGCRAGIDLEHGGRLASLVVDGWELVERSGRDWIRWGSYVLAPWTGRLRNGVLEWAGQRHEFERNLPPHALHGLVADRPWTPLDASTLAIELPEPWPWRGRVVHRMLLEPGTMSFRLELHADEPMPAAMGWHPWFPTTIDGPSGRRAGPVDLDVRPGRMYADDPDGVPSGELVAPTPRPWDHCFTGLAGPPRLRWGAIELTLESDCPCWVVYDREPQAVAVEPWTGPPNSLNMPGPTVVEPGAPLVATMAWRWRIGGGSGGSVPRREEAMRG